jgi:hypothetical protein
MKKPKNPSATPKRTNFSNPKFLRSVINSKNHQQKTNHESENSVTTNIINNLLKPIITTNQQHHKTTNNNRIVHAHTKSETGRRERKKVCFLSSSEI